MQTNAADKLALACLFTKIKICSHESKREIIGTSGNFHRYKVCRLVPKKKIIARKALACVAGVQRGGRGEVECEREARSLGARRAPNERATSAQRSRFTLAFNFPPPSPLYAGHAG